MISLRSVLLTLSQMVKGSNSMNSITFFLFLDRSGSWGKGRKWALIYASVNRLAVLLQLERDSPVTWHRLSLPLSHARQIIENVECCTRRSMKPTHCPTIRWLLKSLITSVNIWSDLARMTMLLYTHARARWHASILSPLSHPLITPSFPHSPPYEPIGSTDYQASLVTSFLGDTLRFDQPAGIVGSSGRLFGESLDPWFLLFLTSMLCGIFSQFTTEVFFIHYYIWFSWCKKLCVQSQ